MPAYLIGRTRAVKSTPLIPIAWFLGFGLVVLGAFTFAEAYEFGGVEDERHLEQQFFDDGYDRVDVECPDTAMNEGDTTVCTLEGVPGYSSIKIEWLSDGNYIWETLQ